MTTDKHRRWVGYSAAGRHRITVVAVALLLGLARPTAAKVEVFACEPEWGALAQELGGDDVAVFTATTAEQDPHHVQARPRLIAKMRRADLLVCTGAELEVGWLPLLLRQGNNPHIQQGQPGYFLAADYVEMLEKPEHLDRAEGDVHPGGNPHIQTDPRNIAKVADAVADRLAALDPGRAEAYGDRHADFARRWQEALQRWQARAEPLRGTPIVVHHTSWVYLEHWLGLVRVASLEPKPGVPPSAAHLAEVLTGLAVHPARLVIRTPYADPRPSAWLAERASIPAVVLPFTVGGTPAATDLFTLFDDTLTRLLVAVARHESATGAGARAPAMIGAFTTGMGDGGCGVREWLAARQPANRSGLSILSPIPQSPIPIPPSPLRLASRRDAGSGACSGPEVAQ